MRSRLLCDALSDKQSDDVGGLCMDMRKLKLWSCAYELASPEIEYPVLIPCKLHKSITTAFSSHHIMPLFHVSHTQWSSWLQAISRSPTLSAQL